MKTTDKPLRRSRGFTLTEVMIAVGILAMALPMIATSLMAGMIAKKEAVEQTMATIVSENAVSLLQARVTNQDLLTAWGSGQGATMQRLPDSLLSASDKVYKPCGETSFYAFEILGQRMVANANDYRIAVLVYRRFNESDSVSSASVTFSGDGVVGSYKVVLSGATESAAIHCYMTRLSLREANL